MARVWASMRLLDLLNDCATRAIARAFDLSETNDAIDARLQKAQDARHGDYQINAAMGLAKRLGKNPRQIGQAIADALADEQIFSQVSVAGPGFVNLRLNNKAIAQRLERAYAAEDLDLTKISKPEKIVIDFSSPNIAKEMHVGHIRSTIIGAALVRILRQVGHTVLADNHIGDWGTQFGLLIMGMRTFGDHEALETHAIAELERVYKLASVKASEDEAFAQSARMELKKLQDGDQENHQLWEKFVKTTRTTLNSVYQKLDIEFDLWLGESAYHDMLADVVANLLDKGIAREDDGAICVFWDEQTPDVRDALPKRIKKQKEPFIIRKKDGAFLYSTTDIATARYRKETLQASQSLYVVDARQGQHFEQLFAVCNMLEIDLAYAHIGFGVVLGTDGKPLKTRDGKTIKLATLLDEAVERARNRIEEAKAEGRLRIADGDLDEAAATLGIGAIKYADLKQNRMSDYVFDWDKLIAFKGNAGPYIQYQYARILSIFEKAGQALTGPPRTLQIETDEERALSLRLIEFDDIIHAAAESYEPHLICEHLYGLAQDFSRFYTECPIIDAAVPSRESRLLLSSLCARQLAFGLNLLGIKTLTRM